MLLRITIFSTLPATALSSTVRFCIDSVKSTEPKCAQPKPLRARPARAAATTLTASAEPASSTIKGGGHRRQAAAACRIGAPFPELGRLNSRRVAARAGDVTRSPAPRRAPRGRLLGRLWNRNRIPNRTRALQPSPGGKAIQAIVSQRPVGGIARRVKRRLMFWKGQNWQV
jgi:hypothetical protein